MEHVSVHDNADLFHRRVREGLPEGEDLEVVVHPTGTASGRPAVVIGWSVRLPDGTVRRVQAVTTAACFLTTAAFVRGVVERHAQGAGG